MTKVCWGLSAYLLGAGGISLETVWDGFSHLSVSGLPVAREVVTRPTPPEQRVSKRPCAHTLRQRKLEAGWARELC